MKWMIIAYILVAVVLITFGIKWIVLAKKSSDNYSKRVYVNFALWSLVIGGWAIVMTTILGYRDKDIQTQKNLQKEAESLWDSGETEVYIDGNLVSDKFNLDAIDLNNYSIKIDGNQIYLNRYKGK